MKEVLYRLAVIIPALFFFGWCFWTVNPKRPERLVKLRQKLGVNVDAKK
ncbi:MAG: hypothetical protein AAB562_04195 [Patescibacteria group bacterium]